MSTLRTKRVSVGIPGSVLCAKAGLSRSRLSLIEQGYLKPSAKELERINAALDELVSAKAAIQKTAASHGWPGAVVRL